MSTNAKEVSETVIRDAQEIVDQSIHPLLEELEQKNELVAETPLAKFQKVLKIYHGLKPLFSVLVNLPLIPAVWRTAIAMFDQALEAMSDVAGPIAAHFKAGKDI